MKTTIVTEIATGSALEAAPQLTERLRSRFDGQEPTLLVAFASGRQPLDAIVKPLSADFPSATILGASTAGEFIEDRCSKGSAAVFALAGDYRAHAGLGLGFKESPRRAITAALAGAPRVVPGYPHTTAIVLLDPAGADGEEATRITASILGPDVRVVGGIAGDDHGMSRTFVACGSEARGDAIAIGLVFSKAPLGLGVSRCHTPISPPLRVTRSDGNVVIEVDGRPAWSVWLDHARIAALDHNIDVDTLSPEEELAFLLRFEAALTSAGGGYAIRAPLARRRDGAITFAGGVERGAVLRITESSPNQQVRGAREAARRAVQELGGTKAAGALVFDCVCRNMLLQGSFSKAVRGISEELGDAPIAGFEGYGEIARRAGDARGFHNATSVVLAFPAA